MQPVTGAANGVPSMLHQMHAAGLGATPTLSSLPNMATSALGAAGLPASVNSHSGTGLKSTLSTPFGSIGTNTPSKLKQNGEQVS